MARTDLGSAIAHVATLIGLYKNADTDNMEQFIKRCQQENIFLSYNGSIAKLVSKFIVEPVIICSDKLKTHELTDKINKLHTDIFASFYAQAFQILTSTHNMNANVALELLSTDTGSFISATTSRVLNVLAQEGHVGGFHADLISDGKYLNISFGLEAGSSKKGNLSFDNMRDAVKALDFNRAIQDGENEKMKAANGNSRNVANNTTGSNGSGSGNNGNGNNGNGNNGNGNRNGNSRNVKNPNSNGSGNGNNGNGNNGNGNNNTNGNGSGKGRVGVIRETSIKSVKDDDNLAMSTIFKTFEITITQTTVDGKKLPTLVIPITIKTYVIYTKVEQILNMVEPQDMKKSFLYRLDEYKSGAIKFRDLIFAGDLIKSYKKNKLKDKDNLLQLMSNRNMTSANKAIKVGKEGFEKFYNMIILTADEVPLFKRPVGGDIEKPNYKEKFLNMVRGLSFTIVDLDYERISVHIKDLTGKSDISFNGLKRKKDGDFQLTDFLKTMMNNNHPVF